MPDTALTSPGSELTYLSGIQALVQLPMMQHERDVAAGLNTAGFVSGYRGSPLGNLDESLWKARALAAHRSTSCRASTRTGGDRRLGHAAGQPVPRRQIRRRLRHVVRQGPRRRPQHGRVQARQRGRHLAARRGAAGGGRRPRRLVLHHPAPVRPHLLRRHGAAAVPGRGAGIPGLRRARLGDVALFRLRIGMRAIADTVETSAWVVVDPHRVESGCRPTSQCRRAACPPAGRTRRRTRNALLQRYKVYAAHGLRPGQ